MTGPFDNPVGALTTAIETIVFNAFVFDDALIAWERSEGTRELPEGLIAAQARQVITTREVPIAVLAAALRNGADVLREVADEIDDATPDEDDPPEDPD